MNGMELFFLIVFATLAAFGLWMVVKRGFSGALMGGDIEKTYGEVCFSSHGLVSHTFKVHRLMKKGTPQIVLEYRQGAIGGGQVIPLSLTKTEASNLARLLSEAANEI